MDNAEKEEKNFGEIMGMDLEENLGNKKIKKDERLLNFPVSANDDNVKLGESSEEFI